MEITYAGVPLCLDNPEGEVQAWLDRWLPLSDLRLIGEWPTSIFDSAHGLPLPNYSRPIEVRLNTWYRPTGASRWSFGLFLATTAQKTEIMSAVGSSNQPQTLLLGPPPRSWAAYLLPPRPIATRADSDSGLWIIPLVDERWYWQFVSAGEVSLSSASGWLTLFGQLKTALGMQNLTVDTISPDYGTPNVAALNAAGYQNAAVMLDAIAHSVGQRIFLMYRSAGDGAGGNSDDYVAGWYQSGDFSTTETRRLVNLAMPYEGALQSGLLNGSALNLAALRPASVQVVFRKWANGIVWDGEFYTSNQVPDAGPIGQTAAYTKVIHTTALADYTSGGATPDNQSDCEALAYKIATDFYASISWIQDSNFVGVHGWVESGYEDYIAFEVGRRTGKGVDTNVSGLGEGQSGEGDEYICRTRIHSIPYNFTCGRMLHQLPNTHEYGDFLEGQLASSLSAFGTATMNVFEGSPAADSGRDVIVTDRDGYTGSIGTPLAVHKVNKIWRVISMACSP